jgi:myo-inositol-1-phosphate synthase
VVEYKHQICTKTTVPKVGLMLVGWGGNNGSTLTAGLLANKEHLTWETKEGIQSSNYLGSFTQSAAIKLGYKHSPEGHLQDVYRTVN